MILKLTDEKFGQSRLYQLICMQFITEEEVFADSEERVDYLSLFWGFISRGNRVLWSCITFLEYYGWYILAVSILIGINWSRIQRYLDQLYSKYEERRYAAKYHKNPDLALERLEGIQRARQRMQEELDRKAREYAEKMRERELQKAREKIAKAEENSKGNVLGYGGTDYNPLMGDTSRGYRAPRRSGCPGGGCGR